jgi:hypothetical protein
MSFDYWADNITEGKPATLGYLLSQLRNEDLDYIKEKWRDGEHKLKYFQGKIILRGRSSEGVAYKMTLMPKGILRSTFERNHKTLKNIIKSQQIKLTRVENEQQKF